MTHDDKPFLVTGGAGFIGSHLVELLVNQGHRVLVLDDFSTGRYTNLEFEGHKNRVELVVGSVLDEKLVEDMVKQSSRVFHLASVVGVKLVIDEPVRTIESIAEGTSVVLRQCSRYRRPVLITSTSEVYGKSTRLPMREDHDHVLGPSTTRRWAYASAKLLDEFLARAYYTQTGLHTVIVRLFNTVGPRQTGRYGMVLPRFVGQALAHEPLTIYGDGKQSRCFCDVSDIVNALAALIDTPEAYGRVVNLGSSECVTIEALADRVIALLDSSSRKEYISYDKAYAQGFEDMSARQPDTTLANKLVGFRATKSLDEIIRRVAHDVRTARHAEIHDHD